ncbi:hypothetical protein ABPG77_009697 [Micractinium sp. CCAP 211/92]
MGSASAAPRGLQSWGLLACGAAGVASLAVGAVVVGRTERAQRVSRWLMDGAQPARRFLPSLPSLPNLSLMRGPGAKGGGEAGAEGVAQEPTPVEGELQLLAHDADPESDYEYDAATPTAGAAEEAAAAEWAQLVKAPESVERAASPLTPHTPGRAGEALLPDACAELSQGSEAEEEEAAAAQAPPEPALADLAEALPEDLAAEPDSSYDDGDEAAMAGGEAPLTPVPEELTSEHVEPAQPPAPPAALTQPEVEPIKLEPAFDAAAQAEKQPEPTFVESAAAALAAAVPDMLAKLSPAGPSMDIDAAPSEFGASEADLSVVDGPTGQKKKGKKKGRGPLRGPMHKLAKEVRRALIAMPN